MKSLAPWLEWKEKCALAKCSADAKTQLLSFGWKQVIKNAHAQCGQDIPQLTTEEAWHLIETHAIQPRIIKGGFSTYKDWLFCRPHTYGSELDWIQGGAANLARDAARQHCANEA